MYINMSTGRNLSFCNPRVKEAACSGLVQTLLECMYASVIWELHTDNLCQERGKEQRRAVRFMTRTKIYSLTRQESGLILTIKSFLRRKLNETKRDTRFVSLQQ